MLVYAAAYANGIGVQSVVIRRCAAGSADSTVLRIVAEYVRLAGATSASAIHEKHVCGICVLRQIAGAEAWLIGGGDEAAVLLVDVIQIGVGERIPHADVGVQIW